ncbi:MAG TPA: polysaccharide deacetylase family protein [Bryobacteraceae bacterium]|nr:polysaccharide deacetylase family protein [Bryobacteraceae bacterium]
MISHPSARSALRSAQNGIAHSLLGPWRNNRLLVLCYHGIAMDDEAKWNPALYVNQSTFRQRMKMIRDAGCNVLSLPEALYRLSRKSLPERSVVLTFDDGFHDFHRCAYPVLQEFRYPATVYLSTYYSVNQLPVFDPMCSYLCWKGLGKTIDITGIAPQGGSWQLSTTADCAALFRCIWEHVREMRMPACEKDALAERLAGRVGVDYEEIRRRRLLHLMTPEEVREVSRNDISIELHTHRHRTPVGRECFLKEIEENRRLIMEMTETTEPPEHFCYPSGNYHASFAQWLREAGVVSATTCAAALAEPDFDPMAMPRYLDQENLSEFRFAGWLNGLMPWAKARMNRNAHITNRPATAEVAPY